MLNTALQVLSKDGSIADNTYQVIGEDGVLPQGDVVLTVEQLDQLAQVSGKKALLVTVDASPETHEFPLDQLDAIFIDFAGFNDGRGYSFAALLRRQGFQGELRATGDAPRRPGPRRRHAGHRQRRRNRPRARDDLARAAAPGRVAGPVPARAGH